MISILQSRVSSQISNADIILSLDCDMYSNDLDAIKDALCFFMDEERGHEVSYVQFPQNYNNLKKNNMLVQERLLMRWVFTTWLQGLCFVFFGILSRFSNINGSVD